MIKKDHLNAPKSYCHSLFYCRSFIGLAIIITLRKWDRRGGIADTSGTVQLNKKLSLPLTNYRPQHTLQGFEACLWLRGKCAVLGLPLGTPLKSIQ